MAGLETTPEMFDLRMSEGAKPLLEKVKAFIRNEVDPITHEFYRLGENRADRWSWAPGQLELLDSVKRKAKAEGLWTTRTSRTSWARAPWPRSPSTARRPTPATWK